MTVEAKKYLCNSCEKHLMVFLQGLEFFMNNLMNPTFDPAFKLLLPTQMAQSNARGAGSLHVW